MTKPRDRLIAGTVVVLTVVFGAAVTATILDAQARGRNALERNQASSIHRLAAGMNQRLESMLTTLEGLAVGPFTFKIGDAGDHDRIQTLQDLNPQARTGMLLIDRNGLLTEGTLLEDRSHIGKPLTRPGLREAATSRKAVVLPAAPGITTSLPTIAVVFPVPGQGGAVLGSMVFESVVAPDSDLNKEIAELRQGRTGVFMFVDDRGTVLVSTDSSLIGKPLEDPVLRDAAPGLAHAGDRVVGLAQVPSASWRLIFAQDLEEFEAGLGKRVQLALLLLLLGVLVSGVLGFVVMLRRLRMERIERARIEEINQVRDDFISIVSHELRAPVAGIAGFLDGAIENWTAMDDDARLQALKRAQANARRLQALTRDVLDTSSVDAGEFDYAFDLVNLAEQVHATVRALRQAAPEQEVSVTGPRDAWVQADPERLHQVLLNLLENAITNSPGGTPVSVDIAAEGGTFVVSIRDMGARIADADGDRQFQKWSGGRSPGAGLGLYVSRSIVDAHNGTIWAENAPGGGAVFRFSLPAAPAQSPAEIA